MNYSNLLILLLGSFISINVMGDIGGDFVNDCGLVQLEGSDYKTLVCDCNVNTAFNNCKYEVPCPGSNATTVSGRSWSPKKCSKAINPIADQEMSVDELNKYECGAGSGMRDCGGMPMCTSSQGGEHGCRKWSDAYPSPSSSSHCGQGHICD